MKDVVKDIEGFEGCKIMSMMLLLLPIKYRVTIKEWLPGTDGLLLSLPTYLSHFSLPSKN